METMGISRVYALSKDIQTNLKINMVCLPNKPIHKTNMAYGSPIYYPRDLAQPKQQFLPTSYPRLTSLLDHFCEVAIHFS